jgi:hypothetical protein
MGRIIKPAVIAALALCGALLTASPAGALTKQTNIVNLDQTYVFAPGELCSSGEEGAMPTNLGGSN